MTDRAIPSVWMKISPACDVSMWDKIFDLSKKTQNFTDRIFAENWAIGH